MRVGSLALNTKRRIRKRSKSKADKERSNGYKSSSEDDIDKKRGHVSPVKPKIPLDSVLKVILILLELLFFWKMNKIFYNFHLYICPFPFLISSPSHLF